MMWQAEQHQKCPGCGTFGWEWEDGQQRWWADLWTCHGCEDRDRVSRQLRDSKGSTDGKQVRLFSTPPER